MKLGFIGYGEAAHAIAKGYQAEGLKEMYAWSLVFINDPAEAGVIKVETQEEIFKNCDVVMVIVPGAAAVSVAKACKPFMTPNHIYLDVSTSSPKDMRTAWEIVQDTGVKFVDGAMLDTVPKFGHKVPTVLSGNGAQAAYDALTPYHADMEVISENPGDAGAIKLLRSVYTKNHLALAFEMLEAASFYGVEDYVMTSLAETMDSKSFIEGMDGRTCGGVIHAERRSHELASAAEMMEADGLNAGITWAGSAKLKAIGELNIREKAAKKPKTWKEAIQCIKDAKED